MFLPLIDRFCESRRRWLIVTAVTFALGLLTLTPQVDQYLAGCREREDIEGRLVLASRAAAELPGFVERAAARDQSLAALEGRTLDAARLPTFRNDLVELVRTSGCQLRKINVGQARTRPWAKDDNPTGEPPKDGKPTSFTLETRPVSLSISGSMQSVRELLNRVQAEDMMYHARSLDLRPSGRERRGVQMELELWYFALTRTQKT